MALVVWHGLTAALPVAGKKIGGLETGAWELATGLNAYTDCRPTLVVEHSRRLRQSHIEGIEVQVAVNRWRQIRREFSDCIDVSHGIQLKRWRWRLLWQFPLLLLSRPFRASDPRALAADPRLTNVTCDIWACFGINADSSQVIATAQQKQQPAILFLESNADLDLEFLANPQHVNEYGVTAQQCAFCLANASAIVCQSNWQLARLREHFGQSGILIRNPIRLANWQAEKIEGGDYVLWIGRYDDFHKRPLLALRLAQLCPHIPFRMIINCSSPEIEQRVRANYPANVTLVDYMPFDQMPSVFQRARVFLSTSAAAHEGFPNVILQAAASSTAIVTMEDFDSFVEDSGAGYCGHGDFGETARLLQLAWRTGRPPDCNQVRESLRPHELPAVATEVDALARRLLALGPARK